MCGGPKGYIPRSLGPRRWWNSEFMTCLFLISPDAILKVESVGEGVTNVKPVCHHLLAPHGVCSLSKRGILVRVTMSFLSTPLSAESVSSVRVVRPTSAVLVCASVQYVTILLTRSPSPRYSGSRADARQDLSIQHRGQTYLSLCTVFSPNE